MSPAPRPQPSPTEAKQEESSRDGPELESPVKSFAQRFVKLFIGLLIGIVLSEVTLRVLPRQWLPKEFAILDRVYDARGAWTNMMSGDPYLGYKLKPHLDIQFPSEGRSIGIRTTTLGFDDIGFRDIGTKPPFDVVAVGDSYALCDDVPVEACWVKHVADATGLSIATLGVNGYSTLAEARILERYGRQLHPKIVLLGIFPNDFKDNVNFDRWTRSGAPNFWTWLGAERGRGDFGRWLADHSIIYRMIDGAMRSRGHKINKYQDQNLDFVFNLDRWWFDLIKNTENDPGWRLMQTGILDMKRMSDEMGAQLVVLLFPPKEQIYWEIARGFVPGKENVDVGHPLDVIRDFLQAKGIAYCEFVDPLRAEAQQGRQLYLRISHHWNDSGNAVGAQVVVQCLAEHGLINGPTGSVHADAAREGMLGKGVE
jgi:acetyltransferase AlgX (SGNH hydrolase-like protein)